MPSLRKLDLKRTQDTRYRGGQGPYLIQFQHFLAHKLGVISRSPAELFKRICIRHSSQVSVVDYIIHLPRKGIFIRFMQFTSNAKR